MSKTMRCPIRDIAADLRRVASNARKWAPIPVSRDDESAFIEVRLQITESGSWAIHDGSSCYDVDHSGVWGSDSVPVRGRFDSMSLAKSLWNQACDQAVDGFDGPTLHYAK